MEEERVRGMLQLGGIKCDSPQCFYRDEKVKIEEYEQWVNKPCPICGEILLTEDDLNTVKLLAGSISIANKLEKKED